MTVRGFVCLPSPQKKSPHHASSGGDGLHFDFRKKGVLGIRVLHGGQGIFSPHRLKKITIFFAVVGRRRIRRASLSGDFFSSPGGRPQKMRFLTWVTLFRRRGSCGGGINFANYFFYYHSDTICGETKECLAFFAPFSPKNVFVAHLKSSGEEHGKKFFITWSQPHLKVNAGKLLCWWSDFQVSFLCAKKWGCKNLYTLLHVFMGT